MRKLFLILPLALLVVFSSCKKETVDVMSDPAVNHIPADVSQVSVIRIPQIFKKADFEDLQTRDFYKEMIREASGQDANMARILENPSESGIDLTMNGYMLTDVNPDNTDDMVNGMIVNLSDVDKFKDLLDRTGGNLGQNQGNGYTYSINGGNFVAYNDEIAFFGTGTKAGIPGRLEKVFNPAEPGAITANSNFNKIAGKDDDFTFMLSGDALAKSSEYGSYAMLAGFSQEDLIGNYINGGVDFEDRTMTLDLDFLLKDKVSKDLNMPFKSSLKTDFSAYVPKDNVGAVFTFALDTKGLYMLLKEKNVLGFAEQAGPLKEMGLTIKDIVDAIDGDMMIATQTAGSDGKPAGIFALKIDEDKFPKVFNVFESMMGLSKESDNVYTIGDKSMAQDFHESFGGKGSANDAKVIINDGILFISADADLIKAAKEGGLPRGARMASSDYKEISSGFLGAKGFPAKMGDALLDDGETEGIEGFKLTAKEGNAVLELTSEDAGNFLKSQILRNAER